MMFMKHVKLIIALAIYSLSIPALAQDILYDNGPPDLNGGGYSILENPRRSLLDDFELPPGGGIVEAWSSWMIWNTLQGTGHATKLELTFYGDDNGKPDFNNQIAFVSTADISEVLEGRQFFGRDVIIITAKFPGVFIPDGCLWFYVIWFNNDQDNAFMIAQGDIINFTECWADYEDFPPPQPGLNIFGVSRDMIFTLFGTPAPCLNLTVDNLIAGKNATFTITNGTPGARAVTVYGTKPGQTIIKNLANYCATFGIQNINQSKIIGGTNRIFGAAGKISFNQQVPQQAKGLTILFQSAQQNTFPDECVSNLVKMVVQ